MVLADVLNPDLLADAGQYVGVFLASGLLVSVVAWAVGYVVYLIINVTRT